jgi:hypothetical protein
MANDMCPGRANHAAELPRWWLTVEAARVPRQSGVDPNHHFPACGQSATVPGPAVKGFSVVQRHWGELGALTTHPCWLLREGSARADAPLSSSCPQVWTSLWTLRTQGRR